MDLSIGGVTGSILLEIPWIVHSQVIVLLRTSIVCTSWCHQIFSPSTNNSWLKSKHTWSACRHHIFHAKVAPQQKLIASFFIFLIENITSDNHMHPRLGWLRRIKTQHVRSVACWKFLAWTPRVNLVPTESGVCRINWSLVTAMLVIEYVRVLVREYSYGGENNFYQIFHPYCA